MPSLLNESTNNIFRVRNDAKLTQSQFAERLGIDASYVSKLENGESNPSRELLEAIHAEFNVSTRYNQSADWLLQPARKLRIK